MNFAEDVRARVHGWIIVFFADWEGDDGCEDEGDVEEYTDGLDLGHYAAEEDGYGAVGEDGGYVCAVDYWSCGGPVAVAGEGDH